MAFIKQKHKIINFIVELTAHNGANYVYLSG